MKTKKLINDGSKAVDEMLAGILAAHPRHLRAVPGSPRSIVSKDGPRPGKVGLVIGGGTGHEPTFLGFVGKGLADAAAIGNVFASPPPDPILGCAKAASGGVGVLFMYGNYAGDVMNFDMAAEMAAMDDIEVRTVLSTDDVASAPRAERHKRRGVAGNFFIFKAAGAACDRMLALSECERIARKANDHTFTMGVALSPCSLPQTRRPNFEIGDDEMEIGMGIHGEPGVARGPLKTADEVTDEMLDHILQEMAPSRGDRVAVLVNSLGSTPLMELYIMNRRLSQRLADIGVDVHATWVGNYCTSLEMAGASITLHRLDGELGRRCWTTLATAPCFAPDKAAEQGTKRSTKIENRPPCRDVRGHRGRSIGADKDRLCALDGIIGDADHGIAMELGFSAARDAVGALDVAATDPTTLLNTAAKSFLNAVGATPGPLYATAFMRGAATVKGKTTLDEADTVAMFQAMAKGIQDRGKAEPGEKTMMDAWAPAAQAAGEALAVGKGLADSLAAAAAAARTGAEATKAMIATKGLGAALASARLVTWIRGPRPPLR